MAKALPAAVDAPLHRHDSTHTGGIAYYADTEKAGKPLLLLHSINAAPSAYEMRPLFDHYRGKRPVYAPDLPGFGHSERSDRAYSPILYADAIVELLEEVIGEPADVVALSTTAEFAARAARQCKLIDTLVLISPTGLAGRTPPGERAQARIHRFLRTPLLGKSLYSVLTSKPSIRYFLDMAFSERAPEKMVDYAWKTAHQKGARFAPFHFLSMKLFTADAFGELYLPLRLPVLVLYDQDPNIGFDRLPEMLERRDNWEAERIRSTFGLPHFEKPGATFAAMDQFWAKAV